MMTQVTNFFRKVWGLGEEKKKNLNIQAGLAIFIGFFLGSVSFAWLSVLFDWKACLSVSLLLFLEGLALLRSNYVIFFRRGFLFALLVDGFKVGS